MHKLLATLGVVMVTAGCGGPAVCRPTGGACATSFDCCGSTLCEGGVCGGATCKPSGASCSASSECCGTDTCNGGTCGGATCRSSGTSCSSSSECCGTNTCNGGYCGAAICGGVGETCVSSYDCCGTLVCSTGSTCRSSATCGGQGSSCYNSDDCCGSLYCTSSGTCSSGGSTSTMTVKLDDQCNNGEQVRYKFWDVTSNLVWPSRSSSYLASYGSTYTSRLLCTTGDQVCVGARQTTAGLYWGVDTDNSKSCSSCCYTCDNVTVTFPITCP